MIAHWFCERHPHAMLAAPLDSLGRRGGANMKPWCSACKQSRLGEIMAELRAAQEPRTYAKHYRFMWMFGKQVRRTYWTPIAGREMR